MRKQVSVNAREAYGHQLKMLKKGEEFAKYLPDHRLLGVDPGYLFVSNDPYNRKSIDLSEDVVDTLLRHLRRVA